MLRDGKSSTVAVGVPVEFINHEITRVEAEAYLTLSVEVELNCPAGYSEKIVVDLDDVKIGDPIHISAITLPEGVTPTISDRDFTVATLQSPGGGVKNEDEDDEESAAESEEELQKPRGISLACQHAQEPLCLKGQTATVRLA